jgi:hypothetical protein
MTAPDHRRIRSKDLLHRRGHPHMTHWSVFQGRESPTYQPRAKSIPRAEKTALAAMLAARDAIEPFQALQ